MHPHVHGYKFRRSHWPLEKHWSAKFHVDIKEEGGRRSDLNVQWTLSGELVNMSTVPKTGFLKLTRGLVSKETVVLCWWGRETQNFGFINWVDKVKLYWPPSRDWKPTFRALALYQSESTKILYLKLKLVSHVVRLFPIGCFKCQLPQTTFGFSCMFERVGIYCIWQLKSISNVCCVTKTYVALLVFIACVNIP